MKSIITFVVSLLIAPAAYAGTCAGPAYPCENPPTYPDPTGLAELCLPTGCSPVVYEWVGDFVSAQSTLPNGYPVAGLIGPCLSADRSQCPDIGNQAFLALKLNALAANRAQRY